VTFGGARVSVRFSTKSKLWGLLFIRVFILISCQCWPLSRVDAGFEQEFRFDLIFQRH
jgi:hypothetical protein